MVILGQFARPGGASIRCQFRSYGCESEAPHSLTVESRLRRTLLAFRASVDQHFAHVDHRFDAMIRTNAPHFPVNTCHRMRSTRFVRWRLAGIGKPYSAAT